MGSDVGSFKVDTGSFGKIKGLDSIIGFDAWNLLVKCPPVGVIRLSVHAVPPIRSRRVLLA